MENSWLYEEQFARWKREPLSFDDELQLHGLIEQLKTLKRVSKTVLSIVEELESKLVDDHLAKHAVEFALTPINEEIRTPS